MSFVIRSSSHVNKRLSTSNKVTKLASTSIKESDFFYSKEILCGLNKDWNNSMISMSRLVNLNGVEGLAKNLRTDLTHGLGKSEFKDGIFEKRITKYGSNDYPVAEIRNFFLFCYDQLKDPILIILILAGIALVIFGLYSKSEKSEYIEGGAILGTVILVIFIAALNNYKKELSFRSMNAQKEIRKVIVVRAGKEKVIESPKIVVGDIVLLSTGVTIPADGVLVTGTDSLLCNESSLTGESKDVKKSTHFPFLLAGTQIVNGEGLMIVTGVGDNTVWGSILKGLTQKRGKTPLEKKLHGLVNIIGATGLFFAVTMFLIKTGFWINTHWNNKSFGEDFGTFLENLIISLTLLIVAIPEGLPLAVTISLAYSMKKMLKDNNFVRVLSACETMGNATTICSDKTGTLTKNEMTVVEVWPDIYFKRESDEDCDINGDNEDYSVNLFSLNDVSISKEYRCILFDGIALNSKAFETEKVNWKRCDCPEYAGGNKTECAIFSWGVKLGMDYNQIRRMYPIEKAYPFSSETKCSSVLVNHKKRFKIFLKGASEKILNDYCSSIMLPDGHIEPMTNQSRSNLIKVVNEMVSRGLRSICLAFIELDCNQTAEDAVKVAEKTKDGFVCVSILAMKDPLRPDVRESVKKCQKSGIIVRMVTGDHPKTAKFIAEDCGILPRDRNDLFVLTGEEFRNMEEEELENVLPNLRVLARSTPQDKEKIVNWYMSKKHIVAVTGDGANDALALKEADVGLSMGIQGTDVAKEASDIIILDDSFSSIVETVKWGRAIYDNIRKFVLFQVTINVVALIVSFVGALINYDNLEDFALPFKAVQMLWVNVVMDTAAALAFSSEKPTHELLNRKPYKRESMLINYTMWKNILVQSIFQIGLLLAMVLPKHDPIGFQIFLIPDNKNKFKILRTCVFNTFVWLQIFNSLNARKINDEINVFSGIISSVRFCTIFFIIICVQIILVTFGGKLITLERLNYKNWLVCVGIGALSIPLGFILRFIPIKRDYGFIKTPEKSSI